MKLPPNTSLQHKFHRLRILLRLSNRSPRHHNLKVVETYGTELEGRLLEMSEMLDSNFVLGVKRKRAKREMMEMRSRLYHVRREREAIAVQMDIVRKKHGDEERARVVSIPHLFSSSSS